MTILIVVIVLAIGLAVAFVVSAPLRKASESPAGKSTPDKQAQREMPQAKVRQDDLQAARDAKYQEIRDAELDYRTGKLSEEDYKTLDTQLRAEAIEIIKSLDELSPN